MRDPASSSRNVVTDATIKTIPLIDVLRGVSILVVLAGHSRAGLNMPRWSWAQQFWNALTVHMGDGVTIFFVVSGFLITRLIDQGPGGLSRSDFNWFYARRVGRIVPLWLLVVLFGILMVYLAEPNSNRYRYCYRNPGFEFDLAFWLSFPTLCFNWFEIYRSRVITFSLHWSVMWSLAIEEQFYLFYPWAIRRLGSLRRLCLFLTAIVVAGPLFRLWVYIVGAKGDHLSERGSFSGFEPIAMGALLYLGLKYHAELLPKSVWANRGLASFGMVLVGLSVYWTDPDGNGLPRVFCPVILEMGVVLLVLGLLNQGISEIRMLAPLTWPGRYSYGLYLFHATTLYFLHPYIRPLPTWEAFSVYAVSTTFVAALSYRFFEMPCNHAIRGWLEQR